MRTLLVGIAMLVATTAAMANPVTIKDLVGKKICWDYGNVSTFGPGGKYSSPLVGDGTWALATGGIHIATDHFNGVMDITKQPDGTFSSNLEKGSGKYCK
jgi:hypothetical protein